MAPGAGFRGGTFIGGKIGEEQKKKVFAAIRVGFRSKSMWWQEEKGLCLPISGFSVLKENKKETKWWHSGRTTNPAPCDATIVNEFVFGNHIFSVVKRMKIQFQVFIAGAQLGFCSGRWGSLNPKINLFLKKSQLGAVPNKPV